MPKLLLLSSDTGEGHNSTAKAVLDAAELTGLEVSLRKPIEESGLLNRTLGGIYNAVLRHRPEWMQGYFRFVNRFTPNEAGWMYSAYKGFIVEFLRTEKPDVILSVHPMLNHLLQRYIREQRLGIPCCTLVTDPFPPFWKGWASPWVDRYFVPSRQAADALMEMGVPAATIEVMPLPVRPDFVALTTDERHKIRASFGLTAEEVLLINGGARGGGPLFEIYRTARAAAPEADIVVICGHNRRLRDRFARCDDKRVHTFGFVADIHRHLAAADLVLTKPGALSTCEALACRVPVLLLGIGKGLMPQESGMFNAAGRYGFALTAASLDDVKRIVAAGSQLWQQTLSPVQRFSAPSAAHDLIERIHPHHVHV